jgi:hypothetical protein
LCLLRKQKILVLIGNFNTRTGRSSNSPIIGRFGEEESNDNGARLIDLCKQSNLKIANGFFQHKEIYKFTWTKKTRNLKSMIDYVIVRQDSQVKTTNVRVHRGPCCGTDHYLVKATFYIPPRQLMVRTKDEKTNHYKCNTIKYNLYSLNDESTKHFTNNVYHKSWARMRRKLQKLSMNTYVIAFSRRLERRWANKEKEKKVVENIYGQKK